MAAMMLLRMKEAGRASGISAARANLEVHTKAGKENVEKFLFESAVTY
jgi:hypothetical protein